MRILLIEDDLSTLNFINKGLKECGHVVDAYSNGNAGLDAAYLGEHDVIILDRMLPEIDGLTIVTKIRNNKITTPVLFLSALGEVNDRVKGLKAGGDDYLTKPFSFSELIARIEALNRRQNPKSDHDILKADDLLLNKKTRKVTRNSVLINLQPQEYNCLLYTSDAADE